MKTHLRKRESPDQESGEHEKNVWRIRGHGRDIIEVRGA